MQRWLAHYYAALQGSLGSWQHPTARTCYGVIDRELQHHLLAPLLRLAHVRQRQRERGLAACRVWVQGVDA